MSDIFKFSNLLNMVSVNISVSPSVVSDSLWPYGLLSGSNSLVYFHSPPLPPSPHFLRIFGHRMLVYVMKEKLVFSGKESACSAGNADSITGWGRSPGRGNGNPQIPWTGEPCWLQPMGSQSWTQLSDWTSLLLFWFQLLPLSLFI